MSAAMDRLQTRMELKSAEFNMKLTQIAKASKKEGSTFVLKHSRQLLNKFAWEAPMKTGRLRAGFLPAAVALNMTSGMYTRFPNQGEGIGVNNIAAKKPSVTIINSVPYVAFAGRRGTGWWWRAMNRQIAAMDKDLKPTVQRIWRAGG